MPYSGWIGDKVADKNHVICSISDNHLNEQPFSARETLVQTNDNLPLVDSKKVTKLSSPNDLIDLATQVQKGNDFTVANAGNKLMVIAEQIAYLQNKAREVLLEAKQNQNLHNAACNIVKKPGTTYHLYQASESLQPYFSLLSPQEWGTPPHRHLGSYRLEFDQSWTPVEKLEERQNRVLMANELAVNISNNLTQSETGKLCILASAEK